MSRDTLNCRLAVLVFDISAVGAFTQAESIENKFSKIQCELLSRWCWVIPGSKNLRPSVCYIRFVRLWNSLEIKWYRVTNLEPQLFANVKENLLTHLLLLDHRNRLSSSFRMSETIYRHLVALILYRMSLLSVGQWRVQGLAGRLRRLKYPPKETST